MLYRKAVTFSAHFWGTLPIPGFVLIEEIDNWKASVVYGDSVWECTHRPLETVSVFTVETLFAKAATRPPTAAGLLRCSGGLRELGFIICATWFRNRCIDRIRSWFAEDSTIDQSRSWPNFSNRYSSHDSRSATTVSIPAVIITCPEREEVAFWLANAFDAFRCVPIAEELIDLHASDARGILWIYACQSRTNYQRPWMLQ